MSEKWKERLREIVIGVSTSVVVVVLGALIKGDELKGLGKFAALGRILKIGVPLWVFLIVMVIAILLGTRWVQDRILRKETLQVMWKPEQCLWGEGGAPGGTPVMQVITSAYLTNLARDHKLIITSVYLEGTKPAFGMFEPIMIDAAHFGEQRIDAYVMPVVGKRGETYKGKMVFVDQFGRKHRVPVELKSMLPKTAEKSTS